MRHWKETWCIELKCWGNVTPSDWSISEFNDGHHTQWKLRPLSPAHRASSIHHALRISPAHPWELVADYKGHGWTGGIFFFGAHSMCHNVPSANRLKQIWNILSPLSYSAKTDPNTFGYPRGYLWQKSSSQVEKIAKPWYQYDMPLFCVEIHIQYIICIDMYTCTISCGFVWK